MINFPHVVYNSVMKKHCKLKKKELKKFAEEIEELQKKPKYICKKCGIKSNKKSFICKVKNL